MKKNDLGRKLYLTGFLFLPITVCLFVISRFSNELINKPISIVVLVLSILFFAQIIAGIIVSFKRKNRKFRAGQMLLRERRVLDMTLPLSPV